ncbi:DNA polymerase [Prauserella muralis]|uniref:DNA-directed DNA polymerase family A palm domain-containing protein n=1 Tax=Prauserella muralis TaxID=588067 RepID=A0A2V4AML1_9PSEU|nr:DNA polymerase [Prauserella muralis]PXY20859.1 hypothetical protein BAY60_25480 [Prauserella muralis]TWE29898.1 DNA polymerase I-like protein with 3'-5' exonuclease and polymerase domains [Prauserella muralis]
MPRQRALFFDIETDSVDLKWTLTPEKMFRLGGYAWGQDGDVVLTDDLEEMRERIRSADVVVGHNIHQFDLTVIFGKDSIEPLEMALEGRVLDTWTHATLHHPAPYSYVNRFGKLAYARKPAEAKLWFKLDEQAYQLGVPGKSADLAALAEKYGGFGQIPVDDPEYRDYLVHDVLASRNVARRLLQLGPAGDYEMREQINAAIDAQNERNGVRLGVDAARARAEEMERKAAEYKEFLSDRYGLPKTGKKPLATKAGKEALARALEDVGISLDELPRTKGKDGKPTDRPSFGGKGILEAAEDKSEEALELARAVSALGGLRPLAQSALDCVQPDGFVHPEISTLQRSGRKSTTNPGLTVWTSRGAGAVEKAYYLPDHEDHVLVELDLSQADARIVAAYSGDAAFAERFAPGADAHLITAWIVWGREFVGEDKNDPHTAHYRQLAKAQNHAYSYNAGPRTLAANAKVDISVSERFVNAMRSEYRQVEKWKKRVIREGRRGYVTNAWGRRMVVDKDKEFTQAPALYGQSGTREIIVDGLIRMARTDLRLIRMLKIQVHDALVFSVPAAEVDYWVPLIKRCMETTWQPPDGSGMAVHFPVDGGKPGRNWQEAGH